MSEYHKIQTVFKRDQKTNKIIVGDWTNPEFEYLANNEWEFTEKVDGTNIRVIIKDGVVTFGGRTDAAQIPASLISRLLELFPQTGDWVGQFDGDVTFYGEGYGPKIQKVGSLYRKDQSFVLFDVRVGRWWFQRSDVVAVAEKLRLDVVPVIGTGTLHDAISLAATGMTSYWGSFQSEGIVARPRVELFARNGQRIIAKIKTKDFNSGESK